MVHANERGDHLFHSRQPCIDLFESAIVISGDIRANLPNHPCGPSSAHPRLKLAFVPTDTVPKNTDATITTANRLYKPHFWFAIVGRMSHDPNPASSPALPVQYFLSYVDRVRVCFTSSFCVLPQQCVRHIAANALPKRILQFLRRQRVVEIIGLKGVSIELYVAVGYV
jgi:hypothetical protein